jgi:hypothetical protein
MGSGIAQVSAAAGYQVLLSDIDIDRASAGKDVIAAALRKLVDREKIGASEAEQTLARITPVADYAPMRELHDRWEAEQESQRAGWKSRNRSTSPMVFDSVGPGNALGPGYPHGDELDPVRYIFLKGVGRTA